MTDRTVYEGNFMGVDVRHGGDEFIPRRELIFQEVKQERAYQERKAELKGWSKKKTLMEWVTIMRAELAEAEHAYIKGTDEEIKCEILQVIAVGFAALEQHGVIKGFRAKENQNEND